MTTTPQVPGALTAQAISNFSSAVRTALHRYDTGTLDFAESLDAIASALNTVRPEPAAAPAAPTLREMADNLHEAGHAFWHACQQAGGGAVRWLDFTDGTLILFTRGEYREALLQQATKDYAAPVVVFEDEGSDEDGVSAVSVKAAVAPAAGEPTEGDWIAADDYRRNVKALDVALNGEGGATGPALVDVLVQCESIARRYGMPVLTALAAATPSVPQTHPVHQALPSLGLHATEGRAETCATCNGNGVVSRHAPDGSWDDSPCPACCTLEIRTNEDGTLDEIVGTGRFHLEQMDTGHWWMLFEDTAGKAVHVHLHARGKISANFEEEER